MIKHSHTRINICISIIVASIAILLSGTNFFRRLELMSLDTFFNTRLRRPPAPENIIIVEITDKDILRIGRWPWRRTWFAGIIKALNGLGADKILLDIFLPAESNAQDDALLGEAMEESGHVYLPTKLEGINEGALNDIRPIDILAR